MIGDLALLYNSRVKGKPKNLHTEWMGPYVVKEIHANGSVWLRMLQGIVFQKLVNGARLKLEIHQKKEKENPITTISVNQKI